MASRLSNRRLSSPTPPSSPTDLQVHTVSPLPHQAHINSLTSPRAGFRGIFVSHYVALCAAFSAIGGLLFGYDQGVISVTLVMDQFLERFPEVSDHASGSGFKKGLMTAMITLGAFIGALNQGWVADMISRKRSIMVAVVIFTIGSSVQTAALNYSMLVGGRFVGGVGIGM